MLFKSILGVALLCVAIVSVIWMPSENLLSYWLKSGWVGLLLFINWWASSHFFNENEVGERRNALGSVFGALPALNIVIFFSSIISFFLLIANEFQKVSPAVHITFQVVLISLTFIVCLLSLVAVKGAQHGHQGEVSKSDILEECQRLFRVACSPVKEDVRQAMNYISYKMPHESKMPSGALCELQCALREVDASDEESLRALMQSITRM